MNFDFNIKSMNRKSVLGKLLASENIRVHYSNDVSTASFDIHGRTLVVHIFKRTVSNYLVDMFLAHEASHALNTPAGEWKHAIDSISRDFNVDKNVAKNYLNVVEDVRINKLIQKKYPGTKIDFRYGYAERFRNHDYGTTNPAVINNMNMIDRLNIYAKAGHCVDVLFSGEEIKLVKEAFRATTFTEVEKVTRKILKHSIQNETQNQSQNRKDAEDSFELKMDPYGIELQSVPSADKEQGEVDNGCLVSSNEEGVKIQLTIEQIEGSTDNLEQHTQANYADKNAPSNVFHYSFYDEPTFSNHYKDLVRLKKPTAVIDSEWRKHANNLVAYMAHEFEAVKAAHDFTYQSYKNTGDLDLNSLAYYRTREDIFQKRVLLPEHKNHGFFFLVDMSQSMQYHMAETRRQVLLFVMLARRLNIPFEVYSFTERLASRHFNNASNNFGIGKMFSSEMTKAEFDFMVNRWAYESHTQLTDNERSGGGTPLAHATLAMYPLIHDFVRKNKVEIFNFISITDGDAGDSIGGTGSFHRTKTTIEMKQAKKSYTFDKVMYHADILGLLKEVLLEDGIQSNFVDFYIARKVENGFAVSQREGYDESYTIDKSILGGKFSNFDNHIKYNTTYIEQKLSSDELHQHFADYAKGKTSHKKLLRKMVQKLAKFD